MATALTRAVACHARALLSCALELKWPLVSRCVRTSAQRKQGMRIIHSRRDRNAIPHHAYKRV
eukprot:3535997-Alexandrium_andersonii.AAC.1